MKKQLSTILSSLLITSAVSAQDINVQSGWQLLGATSDVNLATIGSSSCTDYVWKYNANTTDVNNRWELHVANGLNYNYSGPIITSISAGEGFWLKGNANCPNINISGATSTTPDTSTGFTLDMILGKTFYGATQPVDTSIAPYTSVTTFHTDGTRSSSRDGSTQPNANYEIKNGDLYVSNTAINIILKIIPNDTTSGALLTLEIYDNSGTTPVKTATRFSFASQTALDTFVAAYPTTTIPVSDLTITTTTADLITLEGSLVYAFEEDNSDWYTHFSFATSDFTGTDYEYTGSSWEIEEDGTFSGTVTKNSDHNISIFESTEGFGADIIFTQTEQITAIDGVSYTDLFVTDIEIHVTAVGTGWTDNWGWTPTYWDGTNYVNVTTNQQLLNAYLAENNLVGGDSTYAMLNGAIGDTSGNIVKGVFAGYCDNNGDSVLDTDCKMVDRTSEIIEGASWSYSAAGIFVDLPNETQTISLSSSGTVQSVGQDKKGSIWHEKWLTGNDASQAVVQQLLQ